jgi:hypothetical protein
MSIFVESADTVHQPHYPVEQPRVATSSQGHIIFKQYPNHLVHRAAARLVPDMLQISSRLVILTHLDSPCLDDFNMVHELGYNMPCV